MSKSDLQWEYLQCLGLLIAYASLKRYKLTQGRAYASPEANAADGGHKRSTHLHRLAQDFNLFVDGVLVEGDSVVWRDLGTFWCSLHKLARWGGEWADYGHFSFEYNGVK